MNNSWRSVRLGDVVDLLTGYPFKSQHYTDDPTEPRLLRGDNIAQGVLSWNGAKRWPASAVEHLDRYWLQEDDVVLAMDRPWIEAGLKCAAVSASDLPALLVQRVARMRGGPDLDAGFLRYLIRSQEFTAYVQAVQTGTAVPHISGNQIKDFVFSLPPLDAQQAISNVLGALDDKIDLLRRMNQTLEDICRTLFQAWFVDFKPVHTRAASREPIGIVAEAAELFPREFEDSEIGPIPAGWRVVALGDFVTLQRGTTYQSALLETDGPVLLGLASIQRDGGFRGDSLRTYGGESTEKILLRPGDLYVSLKDVTQSGDLLGAVARVPKWIATGRLTQDTAKLVLTNNDISTEYLYWLLRMPRYREFCRSRAMGTTNLSLSRDDFLGYRFAVPPPSIQARLLPIVERMSERLEDAREIHTLAALRDTLLPRLLSGELRISSSIVQVESVSASRGLR